MLNSAYITPLTVFLGWLTIVSLILFLYSTYKLRKLNKKVSIDSASEDKKWKELEEKAQRDYQEIISSANKKAAEIIAQANQVNKDSMTSFNTSMSTMIENHKRSLNVNSEAISKEHQKEIRELNQKIVTLLSNIYKDIETSAKTDLENYKAVIKQQTFEAEKQVQDKMKAEYDKLEKEIEARKQERLQQVEANIYKVINTISKDIIGKSLDLSTHEDLIVKSLDKAKKQGDL